MVASIKVSGSGPTANNSNIVLPPYERRLIHRVSTLLDETLNVAEMKHFTKRRNGGASDSFVWKREFRGKTLEILKELFNTDMKINQWKNLDGRWTPVSWTPLFVQVTDNKAPTKVLHRGGDLGGARHVRPYSDKDGIRYQMEFSSGAHAEGSPYLSAHLYSMTRDGREILEEHFAGHCSRAGNFNLHITFKSQENKPRVIGCFDTPWVLSFDINTSKNSSGVIESCRYLPGDKAVDVQVQTLRKMSFVLKGLVKFLQNA